MRRLFAAFAVVTSLALAACGGSSVHQSAMGSVHPAGWGAAPATFGLAPATSGPTVEMFDTVTLSTVPGNPFAVAGYTAGAWPTYFSLVHAYPRAHVVSIAISARFHADCLDVEPGDAVPSQAGAWAVADIRAGFARPCLYSDLSEMPAVRDSLAAAGLPRSHYLLWLAWYRHVPGLVSGYDAVQWTDRAFGRNLDESTVTLAFLGIVPKPVPAPLPVCFHHRLTKSACAEAKRRIASDQRAVTASRQAWGLTVVDLAAHRCVRPYRRAVCVRDGQSVRVFSRRVSYFTAAATALEAAS